MKMHVRLLFFVVTVALAAGFFGLRAENQALAARAAGAP